MDLIRLIIFNECTFWTERDSYWKILSFDIVKMSNYSSIWYVNLSPLYVLINVDSKYVACNLQSIWQG